MIEQLQAQILLLGQIVGIVDCFGVVGGGAEVDECGVCGGDGVIQECGCGTFGEFDMAEGDCDCNGNVEDDCSVCGGDNRCNPENIYLGGYTEVGTCRSESMCVAYVCIGGGRAGLPCTEDEHCPPILEGNEFDCAGICFGTAEVDCAGICDGNAVIDDCEECVGGITGLVDNYLMDCLGICNGDAVIDSCDFCNGNIFVLEDCPQP